jgi:hypothetical protein
MVKDLNIQYYPPAVLETETTHSKEIIHAFARQIQQLQLTRASKSHHEPGTETLMPALPLQREHVECFCPSKFHIPQTETRSYLLFLGQRIHISENGHSGICEAAPARNLDDERDPRVGQDVARVDGEGGEGEDGICN